MEIRLLRTNVHELHLHPDSGEQEESFKCMPVYRADQSRSFAVFMNVRCQLKPTGLLELKFISVFETTEDINEEFKNGHFPKVNAPAVAYPYVRALVSQLSVLMGREVYTLPIRNFVKRPAKQDSSALPSSGDQKLPPTLE